MKIIRVHNDICKHCNDDYEISVVDRCCSKCLGKDLTAEQAKKLKWRKRKKIAIEILIFFVPAVFVGIYFGIQTQLFLLTGHIIGIFWNKLTNFLADKV